MSRALVQVQVVDATGIPQASKAVTFLEDDGSTSLAQSLYTAKSGGSPTSTHTTDSDGIVERFAALGQYVRYTVAGSSTVRKAYLLPDPAEIVVLGSTVAVNLDGYSSNSGSALTVKNAGSYARALDVLDESGNSVLRVRKETGGNQLVLVGDDTTLPTTALLYAAKSSGVAGFSTARIAQIVSAASIVSGGALEVATTQTIAGISDIFAVKASATRGASAGAGKTVGYVATLNSDIAGAGDDYNVGYVARNSGSAIGGSAFLSEGTGLWIWSYRATDAAGANLWGVERLGAMVLKQISGPNASPASGYDALYVKSSDVLALKNSSGTEQTYKAGGQSAMNASNASGTTASASYADVTNASDTITTTGGNLIAIASFCQSNSAATSAMYAALSLDGAAEVGEVVTIETDNTFQHSQCIVYRWSGVSAGSHTVKLRWKTSGGTSTAYGGRVILIEEGH